MPVRKGHKFDRPPKKFDYELIREVYENNPELLKRLSHFAEAYNLFASLSGKDEITKDSLGLILRRNPGLTNGEYAKLPKNPKSYDVDLVEEIVKNNPGIEENLADIWREYNRQTTGRKVPKGTLWGYLSKHRERWRSERNGKAQQKGGIR